MVQEASFEYSLAALVSYSALSPCHSFRPPRLQLQTRCRSNALVLRTLSTTYKARGRRKARLDPPDRQSTASCQAPPMRAMHLRIVAVRAKSPGDVVVVKGAGCHHCHTTATPLPHHCHYHCHTTATGKNHTFQGMAHFGNYILEIKSGRAQAR